MTYEPRLIAPFENSGLKKWYKPWIIGDQAFPVITDAYAYRGSVQKREGRRILAPLPDGDLPVQSLAVWINPATLSNNLVAFSLTNSYLFNDMSQDFFDITQYASGSTEFAFGNGANDYFWTSNYAGSMWTTNGLPYTDGTVTSGTGGILYLKANAINSWSVNQAQIDGTPNFLNGCLIIIPYKGRLVALNTYEGPANGSANVSYSNRARWCQNGTPYVSNAAGGITPSPPSQFSTDDAAWRSDIPGKGGFADADTSERIVSAAIIKDTLIVFFQRSTWRLRFTTNQTLPFIWERLNTQFGSESPYSTVSFDEACVTFSRYGWIASSTNDVVRIDLDIPDDSFRFEAVDVGLSGLNKVQGIRDFYKNFAYFTFIPMNSTTSTQIYGYNYIDKSWTIFNPVSGDDPNEPTNFAINCFGSYRNSAGDFTWSVMTNPWSDYNTEDSTWGNFDAGENIDFPYILGGGLDGNVYLMFEFFQAPTTDAGTNFNFNIMTKRFNPYINKGHKCRLGYVDLYCTTMPGGEITVNHYVDDQQTPIFSRTVEIFSRGVVLITNIEATSATATTITTDTAHNLAEGQLVTFASIVGTVGRVLNDETFVVASVTNTTEFVINQDTTGYDYVQEGYIYSGVLPQGDAHYTRIYLGAIAHMHQLQFTLSPAQLADPVKGAAQFEMQGLVIWTREAGKIRG